MEKLEFDLSFLSGKKSTSKIDHSHEIKTRGVYVNGRTYSPEDNNTDGSILGTIVFAILKLLTNPVGWIILLALLSNL